MFLTLPSKVLNGMGGAVIYIYWGRCYIHIYCYFVEGHQQQPIAITLFFMGLTNSVFRWLYDTIFICSKNKNTWKLTAVRNISQTCLLNTLNLICLMLYSINSLAIIEWRHYSCNSLNAVTEIISWRSLKKNKLIYFIKYFFLKNLNVNLFMCLHIETNLSHVLRYLSKPFY